MLSCQEAQSLVSRRLDGALPVDLGASLDRHLSECPRCSAIQEVHARLSQTLRRGLSTDEAELFAIERRLLRTCSETPAAPAGGATFRPAWGRRVRAAMAVAAAMILGFSSWTIVAPWLAGGGRRGPADDSGLVRPRPGAGGDPILFVEERVEGRELLPGLDGPPIQIRTRRARSLITDSPPGGASRAGEPDLILEIEREDRTPVQPVRHVWH